jgi:uncharacterized protein (TIGR00730 family)
MEDRRILEHDGGFTDEVHVKQIADEFRVGFTLVEQIDRPGATVFGSARIREDDPIYELARETGRLLADAGFAVITGGGPGVMEAANRGAQEVGGLSVGFNIQLPHEQHPNRYIDLGYTFGHFYSRKVMLVKSAEGFIMFPGGFGTFDELFEALTLIQTGKVMNFPVVLVGSDYWRGLIDWVHGQTLARGMISRDDERLLYLTDDPQQAVEMVVSCYRERCAEPAAEPRKAAAE